MRPVQLRGDYELAGDLFAGGGGAGLGIERALARPVDFAINHSPDAIAMHAMNHPQTAHYGEREGQAPRALDISHPLGTIVAGGGKHAVVEAELLRADFIAKHFGDRGQRPGSLMHEPLGGVTAVDHHALVSSNLLKLYGTNDGAPVSEPMPTVTAGGQHLAEVRAFMIAYFGQEKDGGPVTDPMRTVTSKERFGLVYVQGLPFEIVDIGMRMFTPRELARAQGFPDGYILDRGVAGRFLTKTKQIEAIGNSVPPQFSEALVRANLAGDMGQTHLWRGYELAAAGGAS